MELEIVVVAKEEELKHIVNKRNIRTHVNRIEEHDFNKAIQKTSFDIMMFSCDDIQYYDSLAEKVKIAFESHPDADIIIFNVNMELGKQSYWNTKWRRLTAKFLENYKTFGIAIRHDVVNDCGLRFSEVDSLSKDGCAMFLKRALKSNLRVYLAPVVIGDILPDIEKQLRQKDERQYYAVGTLYKKLYGLKGYIYGLRFLHNEKKRLLINGETDRLKIKTAKQELFRGIRLS